MYLLVIVKGNNAGNLFPLNISGPMIIGREQGCNIRIMDMLISRRHCQIEAHGDYFYIKDLGSRNGTIVNRMQIDSEVKLNPGDIIDIGDTSLLFTDRKDQAIKNVSEFQQLGVKQTINIQPLEDNN